MASRKFGKAIWKLLLHVVVHSFDERSQSDAADSSTMTREQEKVSGTVWFKRSVFRQLKIEA